jgi:hypothetical protein
MSPTLPPELVEKILIHAVDECEASKKDLLNCCLANKQFLDIAYPLLHVEWTVGYAWSRTEEEEECELARWDELTKPTFAPWVASLCLLSLPDKRLKELNHFKGNLVALHIDYDEEFSSQGLSAFSRLQYLTYLTLTLSSVFETSAFLLEVVQNIKALSSLKHLALDGWTAGDDEIDNLAALSFPPSLTAFHVRNLEGAKAAPLLEHLCISSPGLHLSHLTLLDVSVLIVSRIVKVHASSLRTLSFILDPEFASHNFLLNPMLDLRQGQLGLDVEAGGSGAFADALFGINKDLTSGKRLCCDTLTIAGEETWDLTTCTFWLRGMHESQPENDFAAVIRRIAEAPEPTEQQKYINLMLHILLRGQIDDHIYVDSLWPSFPLVGTEALLRRGKALRRAEELGGEAEGTGRGQ